MEKIKLGIVGFGFMGHCDADMMATFDDIDLVAVADTLSLIHISEPTRRS